MGIDNADRSKNERERRSMKQTWMHVVFPCYRKRMDKQKDSGNEKWAVAGGGGRRKERESYVKSVNNFS